MAINRRSSSIKDSILMPPPKAVTNCSVVSKSDTSEELKKNLKETSLNALTNRKLYKNMLEELRDENVIKLSQIPNFLTKSLHLNTPSCAASNMTSNSIKSFSKDKDKSSSFMNLSIDARYNNQSSNVSVANNASINNLNINCYKRSFNELNDDSSINLSMQNTVPHLFENKIYKQLQPPKSPQEIITFVEQLSSILNKYKFKGSYQMKVELETRYSDYLNQALKPDYFKECLVSLQTKIFFKLNSVLYFQHEANLKEKEKSALNNDEINTNANNNLHINSSIISNEQKEKLKELSKDKDKDKVKHDSNKESKDSKEILESSCKDKEITFLNNKRRSLGLDVKTQIIPKMSQFSSNYNSGISYSSYKSHNTQEFLSPKNEKIFNDIKSFTHDIELSEKDNSISIVNESFNKPLDYCTRSVNSVLISTTNKNRSTNILIQNPQNNINEKGSKSQNQTGSPSIIF